LLLKTQSKEGLPTPLSPMNASLLVEEMYRDVLNTRQASKLVLLYAKAAFDVVVHTHTHVEKTVSGRVR
jgi:hypothetical protein